MNDLFLPQADRAALMPGASYSIPGLFLYSDLIYECLAQVKDKLGYTIPVEYLYGSPKVPWNCGRLIITDEHYTIADIERELTGAVEHGIRPLLTFSVPHLSVKELSDPLCNEILAILDRVGGGVIVSSPLLAQYIRDRWSNVEVHASVILTAYTEERDAAYYAGLSRDHARYVVHPDDNFEPELLAQIPKENATIIVNERCVRHCAQRREHYESMVQDQIALIEGGSLSNFLDRCPFVPDIKQRDTTARNATLTIPQVLRLHEMGFRQFKLQGRLDIPYVFFFDFLRYTLENEVAFPAVYPIFSFTIKEYLKAKARRRAAQGRR